MPKPNQGTGAWVRTTIDPHAHGVAKEMAKLMRMPVTHLYRILLNRALWNKDPKKFAGQLTKEMAILRARRLAKEQEE